MVAQHRRRPDDVEQQTLVGVRDEPPVRIWMALALVPKNVGVRCVHRVFSRRKRGDLLRGQRRRRQVSVLPRPPAAFLPLSWARSAASRRGRPPDPTRRWRRGPRGMPYRGVAIRHFVEAESFACYQRAQAPQLLGVEAGPWKGRQEAAPRVVETSPFVGIEPARIEFDLPTQVLDRPLAPDGLLGGVRRKVRQEAEQLVEAQLNPRCGQRPAAAWPCRCRWGRDVRGSSRLWWRCLWLRCEWLRLGQDPAPTESARPREAHGGRSR